MTEIRIFQSRCDDHIHNVLTFVSHVTLPVMMGAILGPYTAEQGEGVYIKDSLFFFFLRTVL